MTNTTSTVDVLRRACDSRPGDLRARIALLLAVAGTNDEAGVLDETLVAFERAAFLPDAANDKSLRDAHTMLVTRLAPGRLRNAILLHRASLQVQTLQHRTAPDSVTADFEEIFSALAEVAADASQPTPEQRLACAELALAIGRPDDARTFIAPLSPLEPDVAALHGMIALQLKAPADALAATAAALLAQPEHTRLLSIAAAADIALGDAESAIARLARSIAIERRNPETWVHLASAQLAAGRPALALGIIDGLIDEYGSQPLLNLARARIVEHLDSPT